MIYLPWTPTASGAMLKIRSASNELGHITIKNALIALVEHSEPGGSLLSWVLRDSTVWSISEQIKFSQYRDVGNSSWTIVGFENEVERFAREDRARRVGERHIARVFAARAPNETGSIQFKADLLLERVREIELGPSLSQDELNGWHGFLDTNIIARCHPFPNIDWTTKLNERRVTLWMSASLLRELDYLSYQTRDEGIKLRLRKFTKWLAPHLSHNPAQAIHVRYNTVLRLWPRNTLGGMRDSDHLEAVAELCERGVNVRLVTQDMNMTLQASQEGLSVQQPVASWMIDDTKNK